MTDQLFSNLAEALGGSFFLALSAAFGWGVLSILLSPCHLSSIPLVIGYIAHQGNVGARRSFSLALTFSVGILITIATTGLVTASVGRLMGDLGAWSNWLVAAVFILIGLYLMDIVRWDWSGRGISQERWGGLRGAFILGLIFGVGLGPCTFAFLAPVLGLVFQTASQNWIRAVMLVAAFGAGHCTVIVLAGSLTNMVQRYLDWTEDSRATLYVKRAAGFLVLLGGVYFIYSAV